jgi:hypothetical protein
MFAAAAAEEDADAEAFLVGSHENIFSEKCVGLKGSRRGSFQETNREGWTLSGQSRRSSAVLRPD